MFPRSHVDRRRRAEPSLLADSAGYALYLMLEHKLRLVSTSDVDERLQRLIEWSRNHLAALEVFERIRHDVRDGMADEPAGEDDYGGRAERAELPEKVRAAALREVDRLERSSEQNRETGWIRAWLDTVLALPWGTRTTDRTDSAAAQAVLDADHEGLADVKGRIVEHLAVRVRRSQRGLETLETAIEPARAA